ncbi:MAG TPA: hypothetical protein VKB78_06860 [Pirellulales bacterium]|nr:hypothetical protein [Pirellulales bacterium]
MLAMAVSLRAQSPASELRAAVADIERLPAATRPGVRYLSLYAVSPARRAQTRQITSYTLNALSRTRAITTPTEVTTTLLRFSISNYVNDRTEFDAWSAAWEKLVEADAYWHQVTGVGGQGSGVSRQAAFGRVSALTPDPGPLTPVTIDGHWLDPIDVAKLRAYSGSGGAILRADDFVGRATATPHYYAFAGVPATEAEFLKSLGVDAATIDRLRANAGANLIISGVTQKPRRIVWSQGPLGGVYETLDVTAVDAERDPIRRPLSAGGVNLKYDAGEWFAVAPNGLWRVALYDSAGKLQQSVPDKIAKDTSDPHGDGIVTPMVSCVRCHTESGLRPFRDDQTRLFSTGRVDLRSYDPTIVQRVVEFYDEPRLQRQMAFDRETYTAAVERAAHLKPEELAAALATMVREFAYLPVTREQAAREIGVSENQLAAALSASHDPILLMLVEGRPVLRGQWESSFAEAALLAKKTNLPK